MKSEMAKVAGNQRKDFFSLFLGGSRYVALITIMAVLCIVFTIINPSFVGVDSGFANILNIIRQTAVLAIVSIGMTYIILTGGIDLSVGSGIALGSIIGAVVFQSTGNEVVSIIAAILAPALIGLVNGIFIGKMHLTGFIVTLATMSVSRGIAVWISNGSGITMDAPTYKFIGQGIIFNIGNVEIPFVLILVIALFIAFTLINNKFKFGKEIYAIGGNPSAAKAMGINVERRIMFVYLLSGLLVGIGSVITVGRITSAQPQAGVNLEFDAITAVIIGGTSLAGGVGNLKGTIIGSFLVGIISNGLGIIPNVSPFVTYVVKGGLVLAAVMLDVISNEYKEKSLMPAVEKLEGGISEIESNDFIEVQKSIKDPVIKNILEMKNITKVFPGTRALDKVTITFRQGEVHALMGENGAGKSTLMKVLAGELVEDDGGIYINGKRVSLDNTFKSQALGISIIHQEFSLIKELTVAQNIFLGQEPEFKTSGFLKKRIMVREAQKIIDDMGLKINAHTLVKNLTVGEQQMVEIAKAMKVHAWLLIMDEPTSALTDDEKNYLFEVIKSLKKSGVCVVYISHRMQEIFDICEKVTVLRDGQLIGTEEICNIDENKLIKMMIGRELTNVFNRKRRPLGDVILKVENLTSEGKFYDISFEVHKGEVLGFSGLLGAGRTEIARCLFGLDRYDSGNIFLNGKLIKIKDTKDAIEKGIIYVPEDRKLEGFIPYMSIKENLALPSYGQISNKLGLVNEAKEKDISVKQISSLNIKCFGESQNVAQLSGGNQQKVSFGKWLPLDAKVLILDEPTRGIDVSAKAEIHQIIARLAESGAAVILISSEMPELLGAIDNVLVLREGKVRGCFSSKEATQDLIMSKQAYV